MNPHKMVSGIPISAVSYRDAMSGGIADPKGNPAIPRG
jgi:hypothetical protein